MLKTIKCVVIGDEGVGKTCLLTFFVYNAFPHFKTDYIPTVFEGYAAHHTVDGTQVILGLWDTAGQSEYDRLRPLSYPQTNIFVICFSIADPDSYDNIRTKWAPEISFHEPAAGALLVGTKSDLRNDPKIISKLGQIRREPLLYRQGVAMSKDIGAARYLECSALTGEGVRVIFEEAMRAALDYHPPVKLRKGRASCIIA